MFMGFLTDFIFFQSIRSFDMVFIERPNIEASLRRFTLDPQSRLNVAYTFDREKGPEIVILELDCPVHKMGNGLKFEFGLPFFVEKI